jgi:hypothetical protein
VSRLHLLGSGRLLASSGLLASGLLGSGALLLGNGENREARQNRKTDRTGNQVFPSQLTAPIQPDQKSNRCPQLLFHPRSKQLVNGEATVKASIPSNCCAAATVAGREEPVSAYLLPAAASFPSNIVGG